MVFATTSTSSTGSSYTLLILAVAFGVIGFLASQSFKRKWGKTPWGWPSVVWGVVCFISILIGCILLLIARSSTRKSIQAAGGPEQSWYQYPGGSAAPPGQPPYYGGGGTVPTGFPPPFPQPEQPGWGAPAPVAPEPAPTAPAGWYKDPSGTHELRYFDGSVWTEHVSDGGVTSTAPLPGTTP